MRRSESKAQPVSIRAVVAPRLARARCAAVLASGSVALALSLAGCGIPILTFQSEGKAEPDVTVPEPLVTGSIDKRPKSFGGEMSDEDWRRAHAALAVALDPQGNGRPVKWDNPETTLRGSVNPTGLPYVANDLVCRDFLASVISPAGSRFVRGTGCKPSGGEWTLTKVRAARASS